jgi:hypothetical protein
VQSPSQQGSLTPPWRHHGTACAPSPHLPSLALLPSPSPTQSPFHPAPHLPCSPCMPSVAPGNRSRGGFFPRRSALVAALGAHAAAVYSRATYVGCRHSVWARGWRTFRRPWKGLQVSPSRCSSTLLTLVPVGRSYGFEVFSRGGEITVVASSHAINLRNLWCVPALRLRVWRS